MAKPVLVVVTGRPGAGKTTLARELAGALRCPLISRDELKEGWVRTTGQAGSGADAIAREVSETFFQVLSVLVERGISAVAEAAFQHRVWAPRLEKLQEHADVRIVVCQLDPEVARQRQADRAKADPMFGKFHPQVTGGADYDRPQMHLPILLVDTTQGYRPELKAIVAFAGG